MAQKQEVGKMQKNVWFIMAVVAVCAASVNAGTVAYWRFEEGPADAPVPHAGLPDGAFYPGTADHSGNGYDLSVWAEGGAGYAYKTDVGSPTVSGTVNNFSVRNTGDWPAMFTDRACGINYISPAVFTIEATFKLETGGPRTIVGRDSYRGIPCSFGFGGAVFSGHTQ